MYHRNRLKPDPRNPLWIAASGALGGGGGFTWYVDSVNGNDANTGTSPAQAFATIAALESAGISAGDSIGLARGSTWYEMLSINNTINNVSISAYGTGDDPTLDARYGIPANAWSNTSGNTYQASITFSGSGSGEVAWMSAWENGARMALGSGSGTLTSGQYYVDSHTNGSTTLYVNLSDDSDPGGKADGYVMHAKRWSCVFARYAVGTRVTGIKTIGNTSEGGSIIAGTSSILTDCTATEGTKHNVYVGDGSQCIRVTASEAYYNSSATLFVYNADTPAGLGVTFDGCVASLSSYNGNYTGFFGHKNVSGNFGTITIKNCTVQNVSVGYYVGDLAALDFENNEALDCRFGYRLGFSGTHNISSFSWRGRSDVNGWGIGADNAAADGSTINISAPKFCGKNIAGGEVYVSRAGIDLTLANGIFSYTSPTGNNTVVNFTSGATGGSFTATGNVYASFFRYYDLYPADLTLNSNSNCFNNGGLNVRVAGTNYATVAAYQAATGQDANSTIGGCDTSAAPCA